MITPIFRGDDHRFNTTTTIRDDVICHQRVTQIQELTFSEDCDLLLLPPKLATPHRHAQHFNSQHNWISQNTTKYLSRFSWTNNDASALFFKGRVTEMASLPNIGFAAQTSLTKHTALLNGTGKLHKCAKHDHCAFLR